MIHESLEKLEALSFRTWINIGKFIKLMIEGLYSKCLETCWFTQIGEFTIIKW
jgi:hypothetical protein